MKSGVWQPSKELAEKPEMEGRRESWETPWEADSRPRGSQCHAEAARRESVRVKAGLGGLYPF